MMCFDSSVTLADLVTKDGLGSLRTFAVKGKVQIVVTKKFASVRFKGL